MSRLNAASELGSFLQDSIPLARATEATVGEFDAQGLAMHAPLAPNSNHHGTAFGGSLYVVALAAGWGLTHLLLQEAGIKASLYVRRAEAEYLRPVTGDLNALAERPDDAILKRFINTFNADGRAQLKVKIHINCDGVRAFELDATIAALNANSTPKKASNPT